jgi:translation initiation factor 2 subunit 3
MPDEKELPPAEVEDESSSSESEPEEQSSRTPKPALKKTAPEPQAERPVLPEQPNPTDLDLSTLTPLSPFIIARQATINIGTIVRRCKVARHVKESSEKASALTL